MPRLRNLLTWTALLGLLTVSSVAAVSVVRSGLPAADPVQTLVARGDLIDYLSTTDLRLISQADKFRLIARLEGEFRQSGDWDADLAALAPSPWKQFQENFTLLMEVWFLDKVERFHQLPPESRGAFLDREIDNVLQWKLVTRTRATAERSTGDAAGTGPATATLDRPPPGLGEGRRGRKGRPAEPVVRQRPPGRLGDIVEAIGGITDRTRGRQRRRCEEFLAALEMRVLTRAMQRFGGM